jgi:hypothetical protein
MTKRKEEIQVTIQATGFQLQSDGLIRGRRWGKKLPPSRPLSITVQDNSIHKGLLRQKLGEGMLTVSIITEDWDFVKAITNPTFIDRKAANKLMGWWLRQQTAASWPPPPPAVAS